MRERLTGTRGKDERQKAELSMAFQGLLPTLPEARSTCVAGVCGLTVCPSFLSSIPCLLSTRGTCIGLSYLQPRTLTSLFYLRPRTLTREFMEFFCSSTMRKQMGCFPGWEPVVCPGRRSRTKTNSTVLQSAPSPGGEHCSSILQGCCVGKAALLSQPACPPVGAAIDFLMVT